MLGWRGAVARLARWQPPQAVGTVLIVADLELDTKTRIARHPTRAAIAPRTARSSSAAPVTLTLSHDRGEKAATNTGSSAPAENAMAEEIAGCGA